MSLRQRLAKLEQIQTGDEGAGAMGVRRIHWQTGTDPDVVTITQTGERMREGAFRALPAWAARPHHVLL